MHPLLVTSRFQLRTHAPPFSGTPIAASTRDGRPKISRQSAWPVHPARNGPTAPPPYSFDSSACSALPGSAVGQGALHRQFTAVPAAGANLNSAICPPPRRTTASIASLESRSALRFLHFSDVARILRPPFLHRFSSLPADPVPHTRWLPESTVLRGSLVPG